METFNAIMKALIFIVMTGAAAIAARVKKIASLSL